VGLSLPIDGSADSELDIKGFQGLEIEDWHEDRGEPDKFADVNMENDDDGNVEFTAVSE
jgi:hypothetical protein